jgi:hypothetical protein
MISRRQLLGASALAFINSPTVRAGERPWTYPVERDALVRALGARAALHGAALEPEEVAGLDHALDVIRPRTHVEAAVCVRLAKPYSTAELVDEYVARRRGEPPRLPDHPALALERWGLPSTHRMLMFREQVEALFMELTRKGRVAALELQARIWRWQAGLDELRAALDGVWRDLSEPELERILEAIHLYQGASLYAWCSAIVDRAQRVGMP